MMAGNFREYNWRDIIRLVMADAGLKTEEEQRVRGQLWNVGNFEPTKYGTDTVLRVQVYDKPFNERVKDHVEGKG